MQKKGRVAWQRHQNNRAGISPSPWKSRCFDTRLNPASDPRVVSCLAEQEWMLRLNCWLLPVPSSGTAPSPGAGSAFAIFHAASNGMEPPAVPELDLVAGCVI